MKAPPAPASPLAPRPGRWLWTCRQGFEAHLYEELAWGGAHPRLLGDALVEAGKAHALPAFGRMGFEVEAVLPADTPAAELAHWLERVGAPGPLLVQGWAPDTEAGNARGAEVEALAAAVQDALGPARASSSAAAARDRGGWLGQLCALGSGEVALGWARAREAVSLAPGGRRRMRRGADAPSRAALKLDEALDAANVTPGRGELCVDLGAAPGGWTRRLLERGAKVIAVDPAHLAPEVSKHPKVRHEKVSAFAFEPEEPVDWLFCDMAWRPLEVAQLLAKWGRKRWALSLVANLKLPMNDKNPVLHRARQTLEAGGWKHLAVRQLYHDRDEVTVTARLR